jgi:predicted dehydrogenase
VANEETNQTTRRGFIGALTAVSAASYNRILGANDRVGIGFVGFGLIGKQHVYNFKNSFPDVDRVAMCDCYKARVDEGLKFMESPNAKGYTDFRKMYENKDIQGVVIATPDHWHALLTIMACAAGKDVYVEKPLTVCNDEGKWMLEAKNKYKRVVVVGTQRRTGANVKEAKKIIDSGVIGKVLEVKLGSTRNIYPGFGKPTETTPPEGLDYDMWLGPAPKKPYSPHRCLYHFRWFWDYSGGQMTNLGAHTIDQLHYVLNVKGPNKVVSFGGRYGLDDDGETPDVQEAIMEYPGFLMNISIREANGLRDSRGTVIMGTKGNLIMGSNEIVPENQSYPPNLIPRFIGQQPIGGAVFDDNKKPTPFIEASKGSSARGAAGSGEEEMFNMNKRDWIDCIKSRKDPFCNLESGNRVAVACNLNNMSLRLGGRAIKWDVEKEVVVGDKEAQAMCTRQYRAPWDAALKACVKV